MAWSLISLPAWGPLGLPACWPRQRPRRGRIGFVNPDIIAIIGIGVALLSALVLLFRWLRQDIEALRGTIEGLRRETREMESRLNDRIEAIDIRFNTGLVNLTTRIDGVNSRIDALYQALFSRKDPAA